MLFPAHRQRHRVLRRFVDDPQGARTDELSTPELGGYEGTRRVRELRALGFPIVMHREGPYWRYRLRRPGDPLPLRQPTLAFD